MTDTGKRSVAPGSELQRRSSPQAVDAAQTLITAVHRGDQLAVQRILGRPDLPRIAVALAERMPVLTDPRLAACGTRSAAERHLRYGEPMDDACLLARREYYRTRAHRERRRVATSGRRSTPPTTSSTDVDPVVVERLIDGQPPLHVTKAERAEAVRVLHSRGWTHSLIAQQLAMSGTRVVQILDGFVRAATDTPADSKRQESA